MVRLNRSTIPSDCGCSGVVLVFFIPNSRHISENTADSNIPPRIRVDFHWHSKAANKFFYQDISNCDGFLVRQRISLRPFGKIVGNNEQIFIAIVCGGRGPSTSSASRSMGTPTLYWDIGALLRCWGPFLEAHRSQL